MARKQGARKKSSRKYQDEEGNKVDALEEAARDVEKQVKRWLDRYDRDGNGTFDRREMSWLLQSLQDEMAAEKASSSDAALKRSPSGKGSPTRNAWSQSSQKVDVGEYLDLIFRTEQKRAAACPANALRKQQAAADGAAPAPAEPKPEDVSVPAGNVHQWVVRFRAWVAKRQEIDALFTNADQDHDGSLDVAELRDLLQKGAPCGYRVTDTDTNFVLERCDKDKSGRIERNEVESSMAMWMELVTSGHCKQLRPLEASPDAAAPADAAAPRATAMATASAACVIL